MDNSFTGNQYLTNFWNAIVAGLPRLLGALIILLISYLVAKAISVAVYKLLARVNLNRMLHAGKGGNIVQRAVPDPTDLVAKITYWILFLFGVSLAASYLGIPALADFIHGVYAYIPNVLAALLIFLVAGAISAGIATLIGNTMGDTPTGKVVGTVAPMLVMVIAVFMILNQLMIAPAIVTITYAALLGSTALGMALAFGLGGRDVAAKMLNELYIKGQQNRTRIAADLKHGARHTKEKAERARDEA
jgi:hypothetical protein